MDWKVAATLVIVAGILLGAFLATSAGPGGGMTGFLTAFGSGSRPTNISFVASLSPAAAGFDSSDVSAEIVFSGTGSKVFVGSERLDLSSQESVEMSIEGFSGKISIDDIKNADFDGTASKVVVNGISILPSGDRQKFSFSRIRFESLKINNLRLPGLKISSATGFVDLDGGKVSFKADGEPLEIGSFTGGLSVDALLKIAGTTDHLLLSGKNRLSISQ